MDYRVRAPEPDAARALGQACGVSASVAQVLLHRGLRDPTAAREFLSPRLSGLTPPDGMADRELAAERLAQAVRAHEPIAIFGDYDVDGTTSAAIMAEALEALGAKVEVLVANRFEGGYGFSDPALSRVLETRPSLIVTCDCGSSDHERIERARRQGIDVIVIDHHLVPEEPLPASAFLNPQRPECGFPYKELCSAGLALSLAAAVRKQLGVSLDLRPLLDLVALGTIADSVPLRDDNRRLVRAGLTLLGSPGLRPGVAALRELAKLRPGARVGAVDVAFRIIPRLNAPGRLADQSLSLALLRSRSLKRARELAAQIEQLNDRRKALQRQVVEAAVAQVLEVYGPEPSAGIVVAAEGWHRGVVGIAASRLVERFGVPVLVAAIEDGQAHGSGRTPKGFRLHSALARCASNLSKFGGHQAAVGFTLQESRLSKLRADFAGAASSDRVAVGPRVPLAVDVELGAEPYALPPASHVAQLEPLGQGNDEPLFAVPRATVEGQRVVGGDHLRLTLQVGGRALVGLGIDMARRAREVKLGSEMAVVGTLKPDSFRGAEELEMRIVDFGHP